MSAADEKPCGGHYFLLGKCQNCGASDPDPPAPKVDPRDTEIERLRARLAEVERDREELTKVALNAETVAFQRSAATLREADAAITTLRRERDESRAECATTRPLMARLRCYLRHAKSCKAGKHCEDPFCHHLGSCTCGLDAVIEGLHLERIEREEQRDE